MNEYALGHSIVLLAMLAMILIRLPYARARRRVTVVDNRRDRQESLLLALVSVSMMLLPLLGATTSWLDFARYQGSPLLMTLGAAALLPAIWLFWRSHADLGDNWSVTLELHARQTLVTRGVYCRLRHPMYAAIWLWALAQALLLPNWISGPAALASFGLMYWLRVPREEAMLLSRFGDAYRDYMHHTGRLWPRALAG